MTNTVHSPWNIEHALHLLSCGRPRAAIPALSPIWKQSFDALKDLPSAEFAAALWTTDEALPSYVDALNQFGGSAHILTENNAVKDINQWVSQSTHHKIPRIIESLDAEIEAFLATALYLNADWATLFNKGKMLFQDTPDILSLTDTRFLALDGSNQDGWHILLPYADEDLYAVVSTRPASIPPLQWEQHINTCFSMPQFHAASTWTYPNFPLDIKAYVNNQFDGITHNPLVIDSATHKAVIDVDHVGTTAAAVTGMRMAAISLPREPLVINVDDTFCFRVYHKSSVLFEANINNL